MDEYDCIIGNNIRLNKWHSDTFHQHDKTNGAL